MVVAAQLSVYPLRQPRLSPAIERALGLLEVQGLQVTRGTMSSYVVGEDEVLFGALRGALGAIAEECEVVMVVTLSNACPAEP